jgi:protein-disulfide isomerase
MSDLKTKLLADVERNSAPARRYNLPMLLMLSVVGGLALLLSAVFLFGSDDNNVAVAGEQPAHGFMDVRPDMQTTATLGAILNTQVPDGDARATLDAAIQTEIDAAVQATFIALTPTATLPPTAAPIDTTFTEDNPTLGPEDAPITIVEFSDYFCGFCGRFHSQTLQPLLDHYGDLVRFVYREYPIIGGQQSADVGAAAQCAGFQGKYWEFSDLIWENRTSPERPAIDGNLLTEWANEVELDFDEFATCIEEGRGFEIVLADFEAGRDYEITGTPTFFINGVRFVGAQPLENFQNIIDAELRELGIEPPPRS